MIISMGRVYYLLFNLTNADFSRLYKSTAFFSCVLLSASNFNAILSQPIRDNDGNKIIIIKVMLCD